MERPENGWTLETLKEHLTELMDAGFKRLGERLDEQEGRNKERFVHAQTSVGLALTAADRAVTKAEEANNKRFDSTNEWRATVNDITSRLATRQEQEALSKAQKNYGIQTGIIGFGVLASLIFSIISMFRK